MANVNLEEKMAALEVVKEASEEAVKEAVASVKNALKNGDLNAYGEARKNLDKDLSDYNACIRKEKFIELLREENPIIAAVKAFNVKALKVKEIRNEETDLITNITLAEKEVVIDLEEFCKYGELDTTWAHDTVVLLNLLAVRKTDIYKMTASELNKKSDIFIRAVKDKKDGKEPDSKKKIVDLIQKIIDEAIFVDNGEGKNAYKCTTHDILFIENTITKLSKKEKCTIEIIAPRAFKLVMMNVFAHCLGEAYKVKAPKIKDNA